MHSVAFYVRDVATTIPAIALCLRPKDEAQREVLARAGYGTSEQQQEKYVMLFRADGSEKACADPHDARRDRSTMFFAHLWVTRHYDKLEDGMHLDVEPFRLAAEKGDFSWQNLPDPPLKDPDCERFRP